MGQLIEATAEVTLVATTCSRCGITFGLPENYRRARRNDHESWFCPERALPVLPGGVPDAEKAERLRKAEEQRRREAEAREVHLQDHLQAERRSAAALRGHLTRTRNRLANGVCPVADCRRHFDNVEAHIATKHPDYRLEDVTA